MDFLPGFSAILADNTSSVKQIIPNFNFFAAWDLDTTLIA